MSSAAPVDHAESRVVSMRALAQLAEVALLRRARLDGAIARLQQATELDPNSPEARYRLAATLSRWEQPGPLWQCGARRRDQDALEAFDALQRDFPGYRALQVATERALLHTRRHRFTEAQQAYRQALTLSLGGPMEATLHNNLAEVTMLAGDLEGALAHYAQGLRLGREPRDRALSLWGGAVALDRLGEHAAALERARRALQAEHRPMAALTSDGVFFEPPHERHYYEALGHEANALETPEERRQHLEQARLAWEQYLRKAPPSEGFVINAKANLKRVRANLEQTGPAVEQPLD